MHFDPIMRAIIDISILVAFAKILAGIMKRLDMPEVLGELFAGMILGPFALGSLQISGEPLVAFNEHVLAFAEIGAILMLFVAGLEVGFAQFKAVGVQSFLIGASGVVVPFFLGLYITLLYRDFDSFEHVFQGHAWCLGPGLQIFLSRLTR